MKNRAAILLLFTANAISGVAQGISMIAIPWYFARLSAMSQFGWLYWGATLLSVLWVPVCGMWVDKYDRKRLFLVLNLVCGALVGAVSVWGMASGMLPWYAVGFVFVVTFFNYNLHYPALYAFAQEITEPVFYGRITSLLEIVQQSISVLAGAAAAVLLEGWGSQTLRLGDFVWTISPLEPWPIYRIFSVDAATYFASFL
ncbi:MAG: MFS transporter permease, partial [Bacteroidetes bacterium]